MNDKKIIVPFLLAVTVVGQLYAERDFDRNEHRRDDNRRGDYEQSREMNYRNDTYRLFENRYAENRDHHVELPTHRRPGWSVAHVPLAAIVLSVAGLNYYYHEGLFYHPREGQYIIVEPPIGGVVPMLPRGYSVVRSYNRDYYFYENTYYERIPNSESYRVIEFSPSNEMSSRQENYRLGSIIYHLPNGAEARYIDGRQYYYFEGQYFLPTVQNGGVAYVVVDPR